MLHHQMGLAAVVFNPVRFWSKSRFNSLSVMPREPLDQQRD